MDLMAAMLAGLLLIVAAAAARPAATVPIAKESASAEDSKIEEK